MIRLAFSFLLLNAVVWAGETEKHVSIPATEFKAEMTKQRGVLLDLRTPKEYRAGHLEGCRLINYHEEDFRAELDKLAKDETYFIYCRSGGRSGRTLALMKDMGFARVYDMSDGIIGWKAAGYPLVTPKQ